jgi:hypothetical protein
MPRPWQDTVAPPVAVHARHERRDAHGGRWGSARRFYGSLCVEEQQYQAKGSTQRSRGESPTSIKRREAHNDREESHPPQRGAKEQASDGTQAAARARREAARPRTLTHLLDVPVAGRRVVVLRREGNEGHSRHEASNEALDRCGHRMVAILSEQSSPACEHGTLLCAPRWRTRAAPARL